MKVKIKTDSNLFELKSEAIAYYLTHEIDYKPYNWFQSLTYLYQCGADCINCDGDDGENPHETDLNEEYKEFEVIDSFMIDDFMVVQINNRGTWLWTAMFEEV